MYSEFDFGRRLSQLRERKGVSARDMSLSMGQNPGYINKVENGKAMPSMEVFFYICEGLPCIHGMGGAVPVAENREIRQGKRYAFQREPSYGYSHLLL